MTRGSDIGAELRRLGQRLWQPRPLAALAAVSGLAGVALAAGVCTGSSAETRRDLGGLVNAVDDEPAAIEVSRAAEDPAELARALARPHHLAAAALGAHALTASSEIVVREGDAEVERLSDDTSITYDREGGYHALMENSKDYGREVYFVDGELYLRPRFGRYHRRAPERDAEPDAIADELASTLGAYFAVLAPRAKVTRSGEVERAGREAVEIALATADERRALPEATGDRELPRKAWRDGTTVRSVEGEVVLDADTGAPLHADVRGVVRFVRDGRTFDMDVSVTHAISDIGAASAVTAPPEDETVATYERSRELGERNRLLEGIAPPARAAPVPGGRAQGSGGQP